MYGNYDDLNKLPQFDLYIGVNLWDTVMFDNATHVVIKEILHVPSLDELYVCLLNTDKGTPFISALEVRHFDHSSYRTKSELLSLYRRFDIGSTTNEIVRLVSYLLAKPVLTYKSVTYVSHSTDIKPSLISIQVMWI